MSQQLDILDMCCNAGQASDGYASVGFAPTGRDIQAQPLYPYPFATGDVLDVLTSSLPERFDALHVSPPCQLHTRAQHLRKAQGGKSKESQDYLEPTLALLRERWNHKPWIVENVPSPEVDRIMAPREGEHLVTLCGSMFFLGVQRHRHFLTNFPTRQPRCQHKRFEPDPVTGKPRPWGIYHVPGDSIPDGGRTARDAEHGRELMGSRRALPWDNLKEGFPPAYTAHLGADLLHHIEQTCTSPQDWVELARIRQDQWARTQRARGASWTEIGSGLGITRQAAQQRYGRHDR